MRNSVRLIKLAATLIGQGWIQRANARDREGRAWGEWRIAGEPGGEFAPCSWCLVGALFEAADRLFGPNRHRAEYRRQFDEAFEAVRRAQQDQSPGPFWSLADWNDAPSRTAGDVLRVCGFAAGILQAGERGA